MKPEFGELKEMTRNLRPLVFSLFFLLAIVLSFPSGTIAAVEPGSFMDVYFNNPYAEKRDATLQNLIIEEIDASNERIYLTTYNFTDKKVAEALMNAVERGLDVRVVIHGENARKDVVREMKSAGVEVFEAEPLGLMHAKFVVLDDDRTISGSANMTTGSFFYDNNFMIFIRSKEANAVFAAEFEEMYFDRLFGADSPQSGPSEMIELADGTKFLIRFSPEDSVNETLVEVIGAARKEIRMLAYSFTEDAIGKALIERFKAGIDVLVIFEGKKAYQDKGGEAEFLEKNGVPIRLDGSDDALMHEKVLIIDGAFVAAGSYNFTRSADRSNDEQILFISSAEIAGIFLDEFEKIYLEAE